MQPTLPLFNPTLATNHIHRLRQVAAGGGVAGAATTAAQQQSPVTTMWPETVLANGQTTWLPVVFSQSFASVPQQGSSAGAGSIGLGSITGETGAVKTSEAKKSGAASAAVLETGKSMVVAGIVTALSLFLC